MLLLHHNGHMNVSFISRKKKRWTKASDRSFFGGNCTDRLVARLVSSRIISSLWFEKD